VATPLPVPNAKNNAKDSTDYLESSEETNVANNQEDDALMEEEDTGRKDGAHISDDVDAPTNMEVGDETTKDGEVRAEADETQDASEQETYYETEDTFLEMISSSAGDGTSLFTSCEPGRYGQFLTKKLLEDSATEWIDETMNSLLNMYGLQKCARVSGSNNAEMPREETKVRPDSFIMDYITTLDIGENLNRERGGKERAPPDTRSTKKRALVVYGESDSNAWNTPLLEETMTSTTPIFSKMSIDLTKDDTATSTSNDTISQLSQDLAFLRKEFNESIQLTNKKRDDKNSTFLGKISTFQKSTDTSIDSLTTFIKNSLTTQDKVITSLATGQASMDKRMETVTDNVQR